MSTVIKVENVSKIYQLGQIGSGTLSSDISRLWARMRGLDDPTKKIDSREGDKSVHVALQNVSFDVKDGEVLGIIGKNGAGKSTMLKILSRITAPTQGNIKIKGRIASLLEVGTGFHPELSGRDNVFLNGAILGMTQREVARKFDEIVDFSGVEKFIDTPVKRYSSGMYVRLAFAVAAHLEPEILIVDEVLSVGDADFQKKCLGKMKDVSAGEGRTVLFVSHNMVAVQNLCNRSLFLKGGKVSAIGETKDILNKYLLDDANSVMEKDWPDGCLADTRQVKLKYARILIAENNEESIKISTPFSIETGFDVDFDTEQSINFSVNLYNIYGQIIFNSLSPSFMHHKGRLTGKMYVPSHLLNSTVYKFSIMIAADRTKTLFYLEDVLTFEVFDERSGDEKWFGDLSMVLIRPELKWETFNR